MIAAHRQPGNFNTTDIKTTEQTLNSGRTRTLIKSSSLPVVVPAASRMLFALPQEQGPSIVLWIQIDSVFGGREVNSSELWKEGIVNVVGIDKRPARSRVRSLLTVM